MEQLTKEQIENIVALTTYKMIAFFKRLPERLQNIEDLLKKLEDKVDRLDRH